MKRCSALGQCNQDHNEITCQPFHQNVYPPKKKKKNNQKTDAHQDVEKREPLCKVGENVDWNSLYRKHWRFTRINKITMLKRSLHPHVLFFAALFTTAETWKQTIYSLRDEQRKCGIYRNNGICYSHKVKEILPFVTTLMDLEGIMLSEIGERKTYTVWSHLYVESKTEH